MTVSVTVVSRLNLQENATQKNMKGESSKLTGPLSQRQPNLEDSRCKLAYLAMRGIKGPESQPQTLMIRVTV